MKLLTQHLLLIIFLTFYFSFTAYKFVSHPTPFFDWDESINVQVAKEMIEQKSFVPLWQGKAWLDKPPLPFLFLGVIMKLTPFLQPEISLRLTSLFISIVALVFIYLVFLKASNRLIATLTVIITSFTPIFLQRSQIVNLDVFLLIGWLGYLLFVQHFWLSLFFLTISILTKSLIGLYPVVILLIYYLYRFFILKINKKILSEQSKTLINIQTGIRTIFIQISLLSIWYLVMLLVFKEQFWQQHIVETHFKRVTASIESHFGQRTYYIDLIHEQLGFFFWPSLIGLGLVILSAAKNLAKPGTVLYLAKHKNYDWVLYSLFLMPWFVFLNLTKTKIFWYLYPAIPQFAFLAVYPFHVILNGAKHSEESSGSVKRTLRSLDPSLFLRMTVTLLIIAFIFHQNFIKTNFFTTFYSKPEDYYRLALFAKDRCDSLTFLVGKETREATKTIENLGLTIASTKQWGDHPSIVYYFGKRVNFFYDKNLLEDKLLQLFKNTCLAIRNDDLNSSWENKHFTLIKNFNSYYLFKR
ncbi:hypothetical protein A2767_06120 [Candidatus Roizmanbacteria bacterium RIFCSPHIGHO2_01_FULL_35_10]|uniref:Uncharacterized protein n=1 Tax=Candidatus Roizmanbacteria bacterium RIFCSPLOWO2_01_FULL_35_13 TaxID=1802055 RepID=A0A1F7I7I0_9BACT|nr:MAG: hypothetical protein A2767_06120 [Candidatus Roizmanbacteria bacterium RIFCSPHIGHO2_01_FULL_35_10]OGK39329.1 MAG: hypothetical protein A3A74_05160 [Candidatus Roizmanbacteria bacterium RIFCSPLOWO2_01_FULL_35_13]